MNITLIVPYHANPELLFLTLKSVVVQSVESWELILCDDSPSGDGLAVFESFSEPRFRYLRNTQSSGMVSNWNFGIKAAGTEWISLLHADDELGKNYVELMIALIAIHPTAGFLFCRSEVIDLSGNRIFSFPDYVKRWFLPKSSGEVILEGEAGAVSLLRGNFIFCPSICYRRELLLQHSFNPRYKMVQDLDLYLRFLTNGYRLVGSQSFAYRYRRHESATAILTRELTRFYEEIDLYQVFERECLQIGWHIAERVASKKRIILFHILYRFSADLIAMRWHSAWKKIPVIRQVLSRP